MGHHSSLVGWGFVRGLLIIQRPRVKGRRLCYGGSRSRLLLNHHTEPEGAAVLHGARVRVLVRAPVGQLLLSASELERRQVGLPDDKMVHV